MDIRAYKSELRAKVKDYRRSLKTDEKYAMDDSLSDIILKMDLYRNAKSILCYHSTDIEVSTEIIINTALAQGKDVYLPRCIKGTRKMDFIKINSMEDLESGTFGVMEPKLDLEEKYHNSPDSLCIIPALMYDVRGYRLGYGGGYYDRFLYKYTGAKVGIIYKENVVDKLKYGRYDIPVDYIVTEDKQIKTRF